MTTAQGTAAATGMEPALLDVLATDQRPQRPSALSAALTFAWRGMLKIKHVPEQLVDVTLTPVMFTLMFTYLFGGAIEGSTSEYLQYLLPGILVITVTFTTVYSGVTMNTDMTKGVVDRFRSMPLSRSAPLLGPVLADCVRYMLAATVAIVLGLILGYDAEGGIVGLLGAIGVIMVFASGLAWAFAALGLVMKTPQGVMNFGFTVIFPFTFLSSAFVEPGTLPAALEAFVDVNPFSHAIAAVRGLMEGHADGGEVALVFGEAAVLTAIFAPITMRLYRRAE